MCEGNTKQKTGCTLGAAVINTWKKEDLVTEELAGGRKAATFATDTLHIASRPLTTINHNYTPLQENSGENAVLQGQ